MPIGRPSIVQTAIVSALTLSALIALGLVLAYWTWIWFGPRPESRTAIAAEPASRMDSAQALFGTVRRAQVADAPTGLAIKLLGVVAPTQDRPGYAVMQLDAKEVRAVRAGEDIAPGIRLERVFPDHVTLDRTGARESLALIERKKPPASPSVTGK